MTTARHHIDHIAGIWARHGTLDAHQHADGPDHCPVCKHAPRAEYLCGNDRCPICGPNRRP